MLNGYTTQQIRSIKCTRTTQIYSVKTAMLRQDMDDKLLSFFAGLSMICSIDSKLSILFLFLCFCIICRTLYGNARKDHFLWAQPDNLWHGSPVHSGPRYDGDWIHCRRPPWRCIACSNHSGNILPN